MSAVFDVDTHEHGLHLEPGDAENGLDFGSEKAVQRHIGVGRVPEDLGGGESVDLTERAEDFPDTGRAVFRGEASCRRKIPEPLEIG